MEGKEAEDVEKAATKKISSDFCPNCGGIITGETCEKCGEKDLKNQYFDPDYEKYEREVEKDNKEFFQNIEWEEVKDAN